MKMSHDEFIKKVTEAQEYRRIIDEASAAMEAIKDEIKQYMVDSNENQIVAGPYKVSYKQQSSSRIDSAKLRESNPELATQCTITTTYNRLTIV